MLKSNFVRQKFAHELKISFLYVVLTLMVNITYSYGQEVSTNQTNSLIKEDSKNVDTVQESTQQLEEIVAVGYGRVRKTNLTGSVALINPSSFKDMPITSIDQGMQGRVAGVQITQSSSAPGGGVSIRIRGTNSLISGSEPLYVIDGLPIYPDNASFGTGGNRQSSNAMASLNPADIGSIEILKDASAASIYGSRGANGVVLITTKKGKIGQPVIRFESTYGFQTISKQISMLSAQDYARYRNIAENKTVYSEADIEKMQSQNINWFDQIKRVGGIWTNQLNVSGGTEENKYSFSANYQNNEGIIINTNFKRYALRLNSENTLFGGRVSLNNSWSFANTGGNNAPTNREGPGGILITSLGLIPTTVNSDKSDEKYNYYLYDGRFVTNPVAEMKEVVDKDNSNRFFGTSALIIKIFEGLNFKTSIGAIVDRSQRETFYNDKTFLGRQNNNRLENFNRSVTNVLNENVFSYEKTINDNHVFDIIAGYTFQTETNTGKLQVAQNTILNNFDVVNIQDALNSLPGNSARIDWTLESFLGRINYNLYNKYLLTFTLRRDGSSKFGKNNKWANFASGAIGWKIHEENFFINSGLNKIINESKLRISYGITGNSQIPAYQSAQQLVSSNVVFNNALATTGYSPSRLPNPDLKWEQTKMLNIGLDLGFLQKKLNISLDYFYNLTTDLLLEVSIPPSLGYVSMLRNTGSLTNQGGEMAIDAKLIKGKDFSWDMNANISVIRNNITDIGGTAPFFAPSIGGHLGVFGSWVEPGNPIGVWKGYKYLGVNSANGAPIYQDTNGDGVINESDMVIIGNPNPDFTWGWGTNLSYKNFDFSVFIRGVQGNSVRNLQFSEINDGVQRINQTSTLLQEAWTSSNPNGTHPALGTTDFATLRKSSFFIEDGSFIRLQNISVGYTINNLLKYIKSLRIYVSAQNLFIITRYKGFDPEVNNQGQSALNRGDDYDSYPRAKILSVGISVNLQ